METPRDPVPVTMWSARIGRDSGDTPHEISTVKGADAAGQPVRLTVECPRLTEPVAEGG